MVIWRPSSSTVHDTDHETIHDTVHDADHEVQYLAMKNFAHRGVWGVEKASSVNEMMAILELKHRHNFTLNYLNPAIESQWLEKDGAR